jgi:hypothetical protein
MNQPFEMLAVLIDECVNNTMIDIVELEEISDDLENGDFDERHLDRLRELVSEWGLVD